MTTILQGGRNSGKTLALIKESARTGIYIMVSNRERALQLSRQAREMGYNIPFPVTVQEWLQSPNRFSGSIIRRDGIYIDDIDEVFRTIFGPLKINAVTMYPLDEEQIEEPMRWARINPFIEDQKRIEEEIYRNTILAEFSGKPGWLKSVCEEVKDE